MKSEKIGNEELKEIMARKEASNRSLAHIESEMHMVRLSHVAGSVLCTNMGFIQKSEEINKIAEEVKANQDEIKMHIENAEEVRAQIERGEQIIQEQSTRVNRLTEELAAVSEANRQKEGRIAGQNVTGEKVRQMNAERQNFLGLVKIYRNAIEESEKRLYQIQPAAFEKRNDVGSCFVICCLFLYVLTNTSFQLRTSYKLFVIRLRELCGLLLDTEAMKKIDWEKCAKHEDLTTDEFISHGQNALFDLIGNVKTGVEESINNMRCQQHELRLKAEEGNRQLLLSQDIKDQVIAVILYSGIIAMSA